VYTAGNTGDGAVKGFVWPDRRNNNLYFSSNTWVQAVQDLGASFNRLWSLPIPNASMVLQKPGSDYIYVGNGNGQLIQIDVVTQFQTPLTLEASGVQIGAPSLDGGYDLVIVGSSTGTLHAVRVPY
jgi:hypothetical protein